MDILIKNLYKNYGENQILKDINLSVKKGEFAAVMGPSGSGKSTLLYNIGLLEPVTSGQIFFDGREVSCLNDKEQSELRHKKIGFVFQFYNLVPELNVSDNILLPYWIGNKYDKNTDERIDLLLSELGILDKKKEKINKLSGGQQQKVSIARALFNQCELILADEPTGNLDSKSAREIMHIFKKMNVEKNITVILVTHDEQMASYSDRVLKLVDGKIEYNL